MPALTVLSIIIEYLMYMSALVVLGSTSKAMKQC